MHCRPIFLPLPINERLRGVAKLRAISKVSLRLWWGKSDYAPLSLIAELLRAEGAQAEPYTLENVVIHRSENIIVVVYEQMHDV